KFPIASGGSCAYPWRPCLLSRELCSVAWRPRRAALFPYTTLFRSDAGGFDRGGARAGLSPDAPGDARPAGGAAVRVGGFWANGRDEVVARPPGRGRRPRADPRSGGGKEAVARHRVQRRV